MKNAKSRKYVAAIDLDGTLLGPGATVSAENRAALDRLVERGFEVVLASGRHPADMANLAQTLPMVAWLVACQGGEVADVGRERVLSRRFLPAGLAMRIAAAGRARGFGVVGYTVEGEVTPCPNSGAAAYEAISKTWVEVIGEAAFATARLFKLVWVAAPERIDALVAAGGPGELEGEFDTVRSHERVFEFMPRGVTKATGVAQLVAAWGLEAADVVAFGDADNDLPLFGWAGSSVAMPHARAHVRAAATLVAPEGPAATAFARGAEAWWQRIGTPPRGAW